MKSSSPFIPFLFLCLLLSANSFSNIRSISVNHRCHHSQQQCCWLSQTNQEKITSAAASSSSSSDNKVPANPPPTGRPSNYQPHPKNQQQQQQQQRRSPPRRSNAAPPQRRPGSTDSPHQNRKLNQQIVQCPNAQELLNFLAASKGALTTNGGGGVMNSVNFSTALHRIARHLQYQHNNNNQKDNQNGDNEGNNRSRILSDPRFALLVCSAAEALMGDVMDVSNKNIVFGSREMSNIAWAIAKLKIAPPQSVLPVDASSVSQTRLQQKSEEVRSMVYEVAKERNAAASSQTTPSPQQKTPWIPALSELCGSILDTISYRVKEVDPSLFRLQEWANLLWALATAQRANDEVFAFVIASLMAGMDDVDMTIATSNRQKYDNNNKNNNNQNNEGLRPQEWSNSIWALATSGITGPEEELIPFVANLMDTHPDFLDSFKPQELSNTVWGIATILSKRSGRQLEGPACEGAMTIVRHVARQLVQRQGQGYKSQELTNSAWAFATLGFGLSTTNNGMADTTTHTMSDYTVLKSNDEEGDRKLMEEAIHVVIGHAKQGLRRFRSQELNNIAWTMARLGQRDDMLLEQIGLELCNPRRSVSSQDIGASLWALATIEYFNKDIYRGIAARVTKDRARIAKPQELSNTLWALATADVTPKYIDTFDTSLLPPGVRPSPAEAEDDPVTMCFAIASQQLIRRPQEFKTQEIKDILWAVSRVGMRHPTLFRSVAEHLVGSGKNRKVTGRGLEDFSPQGLGNLAWAFARQAQLGAEVISRYKGKTTVPTSSGRLAHYTTSFIDVGEELLQKLFAAIAETDLKAHENLSKLKPQDISNTAWAFGILGMKHTRFLQAVVDQMQERAERYVSGSRRDHMTRFKGQEVANALWALATLNHPSPGLLAQMEPFLVHTASNHDGGSIEEMTVSSISRSFVRQELANIAWVCAVFGEYPTKLLQLLYTGLLGVGERPDPNYLRQSFGDAGIQSSAIMSITYLQIVMDLENKGNSDMFSLPDDFPENWDGSNSNNGRGGIDSMMDIGSFEPLRLTSSNIQCAVSSAFSRIGFSHVEEHVIAMNTLATEHGIQMAATGNEILSLDIANVDSKIGIEVDGPGHFISNIDDHDIGSSAGHVSVINGKMEYQFQWDSENQVINGPTALKLRILKELGWRVINIPFWEWYAMGGDKQKEEDFCRSVLNQYVKD